MSSRAFSAYPENSEPGSHARLPAAWELPLLTLKYEHTASMKKANEDETGYSSSLAQGIFREIL